MLSCSRLLVLFAVPAPAAAAAAAAAVIWALVCLAVVLEELQTKPIDSHLQRHTAR
jgi:hypothetical protein